MLDQFSRTRMQFGGEGMQRLSESKVAVFGIGGVGGYCAEALCRSGVGGIDLFDDDKICLTNINRQIIATRKTVGAFKVDVMKERLMEINPDAAIGAYKIFYGLETADDIDLSRYDYVIDAVDTVMAKIELICRANQLGISIISSMGAANKFDATAFLVADIYQTSVCPLAKVMRKELRKRKIPSCKVIYSKEAVTPPLEDGFSSCKTNCICPPGTVRKCVQRRQIPASNAFVPPVAGMILAGEVLKDLTGVRGKQNDLF